MRQTIVAGARILVLALPLLAVPQDEKPPEASTKPSAGVEGLAFLQGAWKGAMWGGTFHAHYTSPASGMLISHSRLVKGGKTAFYEFEVFEKHGRGVRLQPYPGGRPAVFLDLVSIDGRKATFENPKKDYPTRIVYHRAADDRLVITLSDPHGGSPKNEVFDLRR